MTQLGYNLALVGVTSESHLVAVCLDFQSDDIILINISTLAANEQKENNSNCSEELQMAIRLQLSKLRRSWQLR